MYAQRHRVLSIKTGEIVFGPHQSFVIPGSVSEVIRPGSGDKAAPAGHNHVVIAAGAMDDKDAAIRVKAADDPHVNIIGVEYQVPRLGIRPRNRGTGTVLGGSPSPMADNIAAAALVIEHPIHK